MCNGGANKIVFPFFPRDGKVEAWVYNLWEKVSELILDRQSNANLKAGFGFLEKTSRDICEACRKALQQYRNNGKTFHHLSVFLVFNFVNIMYTSDVKIKIERCGVQLELQKCHQSLVVPSFIYL